MNGGNGMDTARVSRSARSALVLLTDLPVTSIPMISAALAALHHALCTRGAVAVAECQLRGHAARGARGARGARAWRRGRATCGRRAAGDPRAGAADLGVHADGIAAGGLDTRRVYLPGGDQGIRLLGEPLRDAAAALVRVQGRAATCSLSSWMLGPRAEGAGTFAAKLPLAASRSATVQWPR